MSPTPRSPAGTPSFRRYPRARPNPSLRPRCLGAVSARVASDRGLGVLIGVHEVDDLILHVLGHVLDVLPLLAGRLEQDREQR